MKRRCNNTNRNSYKYYVMKGIKICEEWLNDFRVFQDWAFSNGYKDNLTIDRINNDGNYEPSNCRWVTTFEQNNNETFGYEDLCELVALSNNSINRIVDIYLKQKRLV